MSNKILYLGTIKKEFWYLIFLALSSFAINIINEVKATCGSNSGVWPIIRKKNLSYNS